MTPEDVEKLRASANDIQADIHSKVAAAQQIINQANKDREDVLKLRQGLLVREKALTSREKRLRLIELRLLKMIEDNRLDGQLRKMVEAAGHG